MTKKEILYALSKGGKQSFITKGQMAESFGMSEKTAGRRLKEMNINAVDGKYYLIKEVADGLSKHIQSRRREYDQQRIK